MSTRTRAASTAPCTTATSGVMRREWAAWTCPHEAAGAATSAG
ncbi:hypothetical protein [Kineococcus aurantiacus]|uniref:Uncharacterized protein n=1 Tax=Kineococcus aurantiacus TaxID=37633 RepID=A0A7Y9J131_9ACTN|nr:hypothetical protein [Kineococcus aurantiacus]NYD22673.1 hypothetical protein [Kineococcus aurantiacus]